jgi:hypothetical protein
LLGKALTRIEAGESRGLVVSRVSRFGRSLVDGLVQVDRVRRADGEFYSVQDGLDTSTPSGRLVLRIMLSMAEWELDRIRDDRQAATASAVARGVYVSGCVPAGYVKTRSRRLRLDPRTGPVMAEAFRRRAAGESLRQIGGYLQSEGVLTGHGNPCWVPTTLGRVLRNRVYLGEVKYGRFERHDAHPAIIDGATFAAAQQIKELIGREFVLRGDACQLLKGRVRCASCGMTTVHVNPTSGTRHCICRKDFSAGDCPGPAAIVNARLDPYVLDAFFTLLGRRRRPPLAALAVAEAKAIESEDDLARYRDSNRLLRALGDEAFAAGVEARARRLHTTRLELAAARARVAAHKQPSVPELRAAWPSLDVFEQRRMIAQVIDCVFVAPGRGNVEHRVTICPRGTAPPRRFRGIGPGNAIIPLEPRRRWINPTPGPSGRRAFAGSRQKIQPD